jgi:hypothetical protein
VLQSNKLVLDGGESHHNQTEDGRLAMNGVAAGGGGVTTNKGLKGEGSNPIVLDPTAKAGDGCKINSESQGYVVR